ncbi:hypothetical protein FNT36_09355 [Hymenobacter setariae]|uniref:Outer membrane protein beta-barrel domain-containing protein n=1 Tax=Hymenobacter setariae TaxID=2594794 RepID=A0A558BYR3_9BACT|nr:hypothetical protein [Hymenobacter setariae]TVT41629.1 hypothetical protein FNT36_09355 [Hymenobacter setariae]
MDSQSPPKGSLEELFRHHLLESEAAAVPPRPLVWDQIDNSLLLAENEKYRRRLLVHRWGMAASLLLAALAGGGWWHSQQPASPNLVSATGNMARVEMATAARLPRTTVGLNTTSSQTTLAVASTAPQAAKAATQQVGTLSTPESADATQADYTTAGSARGQVLLATAAQPTTLGHSAAPTLATYAYRATMASRHGAGPADALAAVPFSSSTSQPIEFTATSSLTRFPNATAALDRAAGMPMASTVATEASTASAPVVSRQGETLLDSRLAQLALGPSDGLPATLTPVETKMLPATKLRQWRFEAAYAATAFNPNVDFAASSSRYPLASAITLPSYSVGSQSAAAEYRANQRGGLGQRLSLRATRWLGGHWSLSTGLEAAQQHATSATSMGFDGVHLDAASSYNPNLSNSAPRPLQASSYRYRSAGVPVELRYDTPIKTGVSFYGRLGAIVSALLNVRTEVASNPETARSYSPFAGSTPYRRLTTLLRGGAGVRYRPANKGWGVSVGPTAEAGVQSLNSDTDKSFLQQNRPYSFGLEAGFEFNSGVVPVQ